MSQKLKHIAFVLQKLVPFTSISCNLKLPFKRKHQTSSNNFCGNQRYATNKLVN